MDKITQKVYKRLENKYNWDMDAMSQQEQHEFINDVIHSTIHVVKCKLVPSVFSLDVQNKKLSDFDIPINAINLARKCNIKTIKELMTFDFKTLDKRQNNTSSIINLFLFRESMLK